jgi:hypothetical protein
MAVPVRTPTVQVNGLAPATFEQALCAPRSARGCPENFARAVQILWGVDTQRHAIDKGDVDPHSRFERAQLLEFFPPFER